MIDPIVAAVSGDSHKNSETRRCLQPLVDMAAATGTAILGISHFSKGSAGKNVTERVIGSLAFGALPRIVMAAAKLEANKGGGRIFCRAKSNIGADDGGFHYELQQLELPNHRGLITSRVCWGAPVEGTARELLAEDETAGDAQTALWLRPRNFSGVNSVNPQSLQKKSRYQPLKQGSHQQLFGVQKNR
ncbi:unnamed protein product [Sphagnum jensenii]|uniref:Uncharacterized protein n=1 Tax=Sphagnum jensenii TaxID=128206 RepID=A0ABP0VGL7_9BRYO